MENRLTNEQKISRTRKLSKGRWAYNFQKIQADNGQVTVDGKQNSAWKNGISLNSTELKGNEHYDRTWPHLKEKLEGSESVGTISHNISTAVNAETPTSEDSFMFRNNIRVLNDNSITPLNVDSTDVNNRQKTGTSIDLKEKAKDWKEIRKIKKNAIKAEKQRLREEEARKKLYEPKDVRIKIVDENFFSLVSQDVKTNKQSLFSLNAVNFPTLKSTKNNDKEHKIVAGTALSSHVQTNLIGEEKQCNEVNSHNTQPDCNLSKVSRKDKKPPKRKDPIQFDISQAIKASGKVNKTKKSEFKLRKQVNILPGNDLDSANPKRSHGKKREVPKRKKLTKLKLAIIQEREMKRSLRTLFQEKFLLTPNQKSDLNDTIGIGNDIVCYKTGKVPCPSSIQNINTRKQLFVNNHVLSNPLKLSGSLSNAFDESNMNQCGVLSDIPLQRLTEENVTCIKSTEEMNDKQKGVLINENSQNSFDSKNNSNLNSLNLVEGTSPSISSNIHFVGDIQKKEFSSSSNEFDTSQQYLSEGMVTRNMAVKNSIHSRKFREYCNHSITDEINTSVTALLKDILRFHDRLFEKDPIKANAKRRHITGLREAKKYLDLKKLKLLIIAPDLENISGKDGINEAIRYLVETAEVQKVPCVFALSRKHLGKLTFKKVPVSCVGIINYEGSEINFHSLIQAIPSALEQYNDALRKAAESLGFQNVEIKANDSTKEDSNVKQEVISSLIAKLKETTLELKSEPCQFLKSIENNEDAE